MPTIDTYFGQNLNNLLFRTQGVNKYSWIIDYLASNNFKIVFWQPGPFNSLKQNLLLKYIDAAIFSKVNSYSFEFKYDYDLSENVDDVLFMLHHNYVDLFSDFEITIISNLKCIKIYYLTDLHYNISRTSAMCCKMNITHFTAEINLYKHSDYFRRYFGWLSKDVHPLPHIISKIRYPFSKPFQTRLKRVAAVGTLFLPHPDTTEYVLRGEFFNYFNSNILHPDREYIYHNSDNINLDSFISLYTRINSKNKYLSFVMNKFHHPQKQYYKHKNSDVFNNYQIVLAPEECIPTPSVNMYEIISCGAIYAHKNYQFYDDLSINNSNSICYESINDIDDVLSKFSNADLYALHYESLKLRDTFFKITCNTFQYILNSR